MRITERNMVKFSDITVEHLIRSQECKQVYRHSDIVIFVDNNRQMKIIKGNDEENGDYTGDTDDFMDSLT
jgi:hypothetical protein